jgi:hypothetical protein
MSIAMRASTATLGWPRVVHGAGLAVEVGDIEGVEVGDVEGADAQPRQGQQVHAAHAAHAGDGHALAAQALPPP